MELLESIFAEWYSLAVPKFEPKQLTARLEAISELRASLAKTDVIRLIRQFYRLPADPAYAETLRKALRAKDDNYIPGADAAELAVIAGGVIYSAFSKPSEIADAVSLGVLCAEVAGLRKVDRINAVVNMCRDYLVGEAIRVREHETSAPRFSTDMAAKAIGGLASAQAPGLQTYGPALEKFLLGLNTALGEHSAELADHIEVIEQHREEESNILYWLMGERTRDGRSYSELDIKRAAVLAPMDLAAMTVFLPGPIGAAVFMQRMLRRSQGDATVKVTVPGYVAALTPAERRSIATSFAPKDPILMPVLFAIAKAEESGGEGWTSAFSAQTLLDTKKKIEPLRLAEQVYSELLLFRAVS